jgi:succinate dehydrogenase/fumarate reductase flavoprotein subunit
LECDLLVIGGGMAGLSAGARASEAGARVIVVEKAPRFGGSAIYSGGYVWTVPDQRSFSPYAGASGLSSVVIDDFAEAIAWLRKGEFIVSRPVTVLSGRGYLIDIRNYLNHCVSTIKSAGGHVVLETTVSRLTTGASGQIVGATTSHRDGDLEIRAAWTILATGGAQGSPSLRAKLIHPNARDIIVRANPTSTGDGLRLALAAGAGCVENSGFYGHLLASPVQASLENFGSFSQQHSEQSILLNEAGLRYTDEGLGDHFNAQRTVPQTNTRALLFWDEKIQRENILRPFVEGRTPIDRLDYACKAGAQGAKFDSVEEIAGIAHSWGFNGRQTLQTIQEYNTNVMTGPERLAPMRTGPLHPIINPPFYALVVVPGVTFTHAGICVDTMARALRPSGTPVDGLLVAGVDVGDVYNGGYAGGLSLALTFAGRAVATAGWM